MAKPANKQREQYHLDIFRRNCSEFPRGKELDRDNPDAKPDFLFDTSRGRIGIEHTEMFDENDSEKVPLQAHESERFKLVNNARRICEDKGVSPLSVQLLLNNNYPISRNNRQSISTYLANLIETYYPNKDGSLTLQREHISKFGIKEVINKVGILRSTYLKQHHWVIAFNAAWVQRNPIVIINTLQKIINGKNKKLKYYRKNCDECWLLIVTDRSKPSQCFLITEDIQKHKFISKFDRTFYMEVRHNQVLALNCKGKV